MTEDIDLLETEVESDLRATLREFLADHCGPVAVMRAYEGDRSLTPSLWKAVAADLGLAGLLVPEEQGGAGASAREAAVVMRELGRSVAPVPFLSSAVEATTVLLAGGSESVTDLASGDRTAALLMPFSAGPGAQPPDIHVDLRGRLTGRATSVAGVLDADQLLAAVETADGTAVYAVPASAANVTPFVSLDVTRPLADVVLDNAPAELVVGADAGAQAFRSGLHAGATLLASEQAGLAAWCLETTVVYLKTRRQFGRTLGGFQALKHRVADLFVEVESASAAAAHAAGSMAARTDDAAISSATAASYCSDAAVHAAEEAVQLHGGIGMTWEHPVHLYLKRAKADQIGRGLPAHHRAVLAGLVNLPG